MSDGIYDEKDLQTLYTLYTKACEGEFTTSQYRYYYNTIFKDDCMSLIQIQLSIKNNLYFTTTVSTCLFKLEHSAHKHRLIEKKAVWSEWQRACSVGTLLGLLPNEIIRIIISYVASSRHVEISKLIDAHRRIPTDWDWQDTQMQVPTGWELEDDY